MARSGYDTFEHGADVGVRGWGRTPEEAFANAARAMFSIMTDDLADVAPGEAVAIEAQGFDRESLLVDWLNRLLTQSAINRMLFAEFEVRFEGEDRLRGEARGEGYDPRQHREGVEVKGATFSQLEVSERDGIWTAQCIVDV
jgi:SHS2 domain-containing protein